MAKDCKYTVKGKKFSNKEDMMTYIKRNVPASEIEQYLDLDSIPKDASAKPKFSFSQNPVEERILNELRGDLLRNPNLDYEKVAKVILKSGKVGKSKLDDVLSAWRNTERGRQTPYQKYEALINLEGLTQRHMLDDKYNRQIKNEHLDILVAEFEEQFKEMNAKYKPSSIREWVSEVVQDGRMAHPIGMLDILLEQNSEGRAISAKETVALAITLSDLEHQISEYQEKVIEGDVKSNEILYDLIEIRHEIASQASLNGSYAGATLGVRRWVADFQGFSYQNNIRSLELKVEEFEKDMQDAEAKARLHKNFDEAKGKIKALSNKIQDLNKEIKKLKRSTKADTDNNKKKKASSTFRKSGFKSKTNRSKSEIVSSLKKRFATASSLSFTLNSADKDMSYFDDILDLIKYVVDSEKVSDLKDVVNSINKIIPDIPESDIYDAVILNSPESRNRRSTIFEKRMEVVRGQVRSVNKLEKLIKRQKDKEDNSDNITANENILKDETIDEIGKLLKSIERNIYDNNNYDIAGELNTDSQLVGQWEEAIFNIRDKLNMLAQNKTESGGEVDRTKLLLEMMNDIRMLKDHKTFTRLSNLKAKYAKEIEVIEAGGIGSLFLETEGESTDSRILPSKAKIRIPIYDKDTGDIEYDKDGNIKYEEHEKDLAKLNREVTQMKAEIRGHKQQFLLRNGTKKDRAMLIWKIFAGTVRSFQAMLDLSAVLVQGYRSGAWVLSNPRKNAAIFGKIFWDSVLAGKDAFMKDGDLARKIHERIVSSEYYDDAVKHGLVIQDPDGKNFINEFLSSDDVMDIGHHYLSKKDKDKKTGLDKIASPVLKFRHKVKEASNASFATHLNLLSMIQYEQYMDRAKNNSSFTPTKREKKAAIDDINNSTGRSTSMKGLAKGFSFFMWAPRLAISQIANVKNIIADPIMYGYYKHVNPQEDLARAYKYRSVRSASFAGLLVANYGLRMLIAWATCGDKYEGLEKDPNKGSWMKIKCGELSFDASGNHRSWFRYFFAMARSMAEAGSNMDFNAPRDMYKSLVGPVDLTIDQVKYKIKPEVTLIARFFWASDFLFRQRLAGDESTLKWKSRALVIADAVTPISVQNITDAISADVPVGAKIVSPFLATLGEGNTYISEEENEIRKGVKRKNKAKSSEETKEEYQEEYGYNSDFQGEFTTDVDFSKYEPAYRTYTNKNGTYNVYFKTDSELYKVVKTKGDRSKTPGLKYFDTIEEEDLD